MKEIPLTQGYVAIVDDEDFEELSQYHWCVLKQGAGNHAARRNGNGRPHRTTVLMHREIMQAPKGMEVDHINGDPLDNQRANLRLCTHRQNVINSRKKSSPATSKYRGVVWAKNMGKWVARITSEGQLMVLDYFDDETDAARAYNRAATRYFGEFARLNEIGEGGHP